MCFLAPTSIKYCGAPKRRPARSRASAARNLMTVRLLPSPPPPNGGDGRGALRRAARGSRNDRPAPRPAFWRTRSRTGLLSISPAPFPRPGGRRTWCRVPGPC